jgi:hypothetical protein
MSAPKKNTIHWLRIIGAGFVAELAPFMVLIVVASAYGALAHGTSEADIQRFAERAGDFIGPLGGAATTFFSARWAAARTTRPVLHGVLVGVLVTILGCVILLGFGASFRWLFVLSYTAKLAAGWLGGHTARRQSQRASDPLAPSLVRS